MLNLLAGVLVRVFPARVMDDLRDTQGMRKAQSSQSSAR